MKVVVTGATGFIGRALVGALRARGDEILALTRDPARAKQLLGAGIDVIGAELESSGAWQAALAGADGVVHLAGESIAGARWDARRKQLLRDSRIETARQLVDAIAAHALRGAAPRVFVTASGADYYAFASSLDDFDDDPVTEADPPSESFLGRLCRDWEAEAARAEASGVRVVRMRTGVVLGGGGGALAKMKRPFELLAGGRIGSGRQWLSWIHLADAVAAYTAALDDARYTGPLNLVAGSVRNADFAKALGAALRRPSWLPVPGFAVKAAVGELSEYLLAGRNVVPRRLEELELAWKFRELREALADACRGHNAA